MKFMKPKEYPIDLHDLNELLNGEPNIYHEMREHPVKIEEPQVKDVIGYFPAGEHQIIIIHNEKTYSIIRGMVSFGDYEIYGGDMQDPERTETAQDMFELIKKIVL